MRRAGRVGVILLLALGALAVPLHAQDPGGGGSPGKERGSRLRQNYPNPFNPATRIPFELYEEDFANGGRAVVTIRIYNVLRQLVAIPVALEYEGGGEHRVNGLVYTTPGLKQAYWDGTDLAGNKVASGIYYVQLIVNGQSAVRKMVVAK